MIETNRCLLRLATMEDAQGIIDFYIQNKDHLAPWDPKIPEDFYTLSYWNKKIEDYKNEFDQNSSLRLLIIFQENNKIIGMINFTNFERGPFQNCRLGYKIGKEYEGKSLMYESLRESISYLFSKYNLHRVEANYIPVNSRSGNVLKRVGFTENGIAKDYLYINGKWQDHILTSLINKSWKKR